MVRNSILQYTMINNCVHVTLFSVAVNRARFRHRHLAFAAYGTKHQDTANDFNKLKV